MNPETTFEIVLCDLFWHFNQFVSSAIYVAASKIDYNIEYEAHVNDVVRVSIDCSVIKSLWIRKSHWDLDCIPNRENNDEYVPFYLE